MGTVDGVNYAKQVAVPSQKSGPGEAAGSPFVAYEEYVAAAAMTAADVINLGLHIPSGARIHRVAVVNPAGGGTVSVGIAGTAAKYVSALAAGSASAVYPLTAPSSDEDLIATIGGTPASAGTYRFALEYSKY